MDTTDRLNAAHSRLMAALEATAADPDFNQRVSDAYGTYATLLADAAQDPIALQVNEAFEAYRREISNGFSDPESGGQIWAAYQAYLGEIRAAWAETDPTGLAPADLAAIGQSFTYLAWLVENGLDRTRTETEWAANPANPDDQGSSLWGPTYLLTDAAPV